AGERRLGARLRVRRVSPRGRERRVPRLSSRARPMSARVVAVVQARASSQRFPQKVLADLEGRSGLARGLRRVRGSRECPVVALATSTGRDDDAVELIADNEGVAVVRGPLDDVLERYRLAAEALDADAVVRVTGDCPLADPRVIDDVVRRSLESSADYVS